MKVIKFLRLPYAILILHAMPALAINIDYTLSSQSSTQSEKPYTKNIFIALKSQSISEFSVQHRKMYGSMPSKKEQKKYAKKIKKQHKIFSIFLKTLNVTDIKSLIVSTNGVKCHVPEHALASIRNHPLVKKITSVPVVKRNSSSTEAIHNDTLNTHKRPSLGFTGKGKTIAIIGTGINYQLETFGGDYAVDDIDNIINDPTKIEKGSFPTDKVIAGIDFVGENYQPGEQPAIPDNDPYSANFSHETLVAAVAAGQATSNPLAAGIAPDAKIIAIKVFSEGSNNTEYIAEAFEFALDPNQDGSIDDRADIINFSISSNFSQHDNVDAMAAKNATDLGVVVVASAGNAGDTPFINGSASVEASVISVGSHTLPEQDSEIFNASAVHLNVNSSEGSQLYPVQSLDRTGRNIATPFTAEIVLAEPMDTCAPLANDVRGKVVVFTFQQCPDRRNNQGDIAATAGAVASIHIRKTNDFFGFTFSDIPSFQMAQFFGDQLLKKHQKENITITFDAKNVMLNIYDDYKVSEFSSRGPASGNLGFKPDLMAPGEDIEAGDSPYRDSGTSFAAPFVAGVAATMLEQTPHLQPADIKAILQNTTTPSRIFNTPNAPFYALDQQGVGRIQANKAMTTQALASPAGISFGAFNPTTKTALTRTVTIKNLSDERRHFDIKHTPRSHNAGISIRHPKTIHIPPNSEKDITVTLVSDPEKLTDDVNQNLLLASDGWLTLTDDIDTLNIGYMAFTEPASNVNIVDEEKTKIKLTNWGKVPTEIHTYTNAMYFDYAEKEDALLQNFPVDFGFSIQPLADNNAEIDLIYFFDENHNTLLNQTHVVEMFLPNAEGEYELVVVVLSQDSDTLSEHPQLNVYGEIIHDPQNIAIKSTIKADFNSNWLQIKVITHNNADSLLKEEAIGIRYIQPEVSHVTAEFSGAHQAQTEKNRYIIQPRSTLEVPVDTRKAKGFLFIKKNTIQNQIIDLN